MVMSSTITLDDLKQVLLSACNNVYTPAICPSPDRQVRALFIHWDHKITDQIISSPSPSPFPPDAPAPSHDCNSTIHARAAQSSYYLASMFSAYYKYDVTPLALDPTMQRPAEPLQKKLQALVSNLGPLDLAIVHYIGPSVVRLDTSTSSSGSRTGNAEEQTFIGPDPALVTDPKRQLIDLHQLRCEILDVADCPVLMLMDCRVAVEEEKEKEKQKQNQKQKRVYGGGGGEVTSGTVVIGATTRPGYPSWGVEEYGGTSFSDIVEEELLVVQDASQVLTAAQLYSRVARKMAHCEWPGKEKRPEATGEGAGYPLEIVPYHFRNKHAAAAIAATHEPLHIVLAPLERKRDGWKSAPVLSAEEMPVNVLFEARIEGSRNVDEAYYELGMWLDAGKGSVSIGRVELIDISRDGENEDELVQAKGADDDLGGIRGDDDSDEPHVAVLTFRTTLDMWYSMRHHPGIQVMVLEQNDDWMEEKRWGSSGILSKDCVL